MPCPPPGVGRVTGPRESPCSAWSAGPTVAGRGRLGISSGGLNRVPLSFGTVPVWRGPVVPGSMSACSGPVGLLGSGVSLSPWAPDVLPGARGLRGLVPAEPVVWFYPAARRAAARLCRSPSLVNVSTPGPDSCPSRGRLRAGPGVCRSLTLAELGVRDWSGWCCRLEGCRVRAALASTGSRVSGPWSRPRILAR